MHQIQLPKNSTQFVLVICFLFFQITVYLSSILKAGVILACLSNDENSELVRDVLKLECKKLVKMSGFFLMILDGISSLPTSENEKAACSFYFTYFTKE